MILSDRAIQAAIADRTLIIDPAPPIDNYAPTAVDLRLGRAEDLRVWNDGIFKARGAKVTLAFDDIKTGQLSAYVTTPQLETDGSFVLKPQDFVLAQTLEKIAFPLASRLAGRVEGRSGLARLGVVVHLTAPTIHADFGGENGATLTLEIINLGPFHLAFRPCSTPICQLIVERVEGEMGGELDSEYKEQDNPLGGRKVPSPIREVIR